MAKFVEGDPGGEGDPSDEKSKDPAARKAAAHARYMRYYRNIRRPVLRTLPHMVENISN